MAIKEEEVIEEQSTNVVAPSISNEDAPESVLTTQEDVTPLEQKTSTSMDTNEPIV